MFLCYWSILLLLAAIVLGSAGSTGSGWGQLQYSVEYLDHKVMIAVERITASPHQTKIPDLRRVGVQPLVYLSSCRPRTASGNATLSVSHLFISLPQLADQEVEESAVWVVDVPGYMSEETCIEVFIEASNIGASLHIPPIRKQLRQSSLPTAGRDDSVFCSQQQDANCTVIDSSWYGGNGVGLIHTDSGSYSLVYHTANGFDVTVSKYDLPYCIQIQVAVTWTSVKTSGVNCSEEEQLFVPTRVHAISKRDLFVQGNGLIYSPDNGRHLYQLVLPDTSCDDVISFTASDDSAMIAFITAENKNVSGGVWFGFTGSSVVLRLHPSSLLESLWTNREESVSLTNTTIFFDDENHLFIAGTNSTMEIPLPLLIVQASNDGVESSLSFTPQRYHPLTHPPSHHLTHTTNSCPYEAVILEAPVCGKITRTRRYVSRVGALQWSIDAWLPLANCSAMSDSLPSEVFLGQSESYYFKVHFVMSSTFPDPTDMLFAARTSDPESVLIDIHPSYTRQSNTMTYKVVITENGWFHHQWTPSNLATSTDITLEVPDVNTQCIDPFSDSVDVPSRLHTRIHIGCPPGLLLTFDPVTTSAHLDQYCSTSGNVSCYYFEHEFRPVFKLVDMVTDTTTVYSGPYTLRALAGGTEISNMGEFMPRKHVELSIWTPVNSSKKESTPVYYHGDSAIKWVCGTSSPCGEILPKNSQTSEYFLLLEASNLMVGENSTYCELSVRFLIQIHGLGMGAVTTVVALLIFLIILVLITVVAFVLWHYRLKFMYWKDVLMERQETKWVTTREHISHFVKKHRESIKRDSSFL